MELRRKKVNRGFFTPMVSFPSIPNAILHPKETYLPFQDRLTSFCPISSHGFLPPIKNAFPLILHFYIFLPGIFCCSTIPGPMLPTFLYTPPNLCYNVMVLICFKSTFSLFLSLTSLSKEYQLQSTAQRQANTITFVVLASMYISQLLDHDLLKVSKRLLPFTLFYFSLTYTVYLVSCPGQRTNVACLMADSYISTSHNKRMLIH